MLSPAFSSSSAAVNSHVRFTFKSGAWDEGELVADPYIRVHVANTALHYGQSVFEGLKAFHGKDGRCAVCWGWVGFPGVRRFIRRRFSNVIVLDPERNNLPFRSVLKREGWGSTRATLCSSVPLSCEIQRSK